MLLDNDCKQLSELYVILFYLASILNNLNLLTTLAELWEK